MNDFIVAAFRDPLGHEARWLCEHYDLLIAAMTAKQRAVVEHLGDELACDLNCDANGVIQALRQILLRGQTSRLHTALLAAQIPATPHTIASICLVNWPLPFQVSASVESMPDCLGCHQRVQLVDDFGLCCLCSTEPGFGV